MGRVEMTGIPDIDNGTDSSIKMAKKCLAHSKNKKTCLAWSMYSSSMKQDVKGRLGSEKKRC